MENKKYLDESKYQETKNKISNLSKIILIVGLLIGGFLIYNGFRVSSPEKLDKLTIELENKRDALIDKGVISCGNYTCGEGYDLYIITKALDPSFSWCSFDEYRNNAITKEYCLAKEPSTSRAIYWGVGAFVIFITLAIAGHMRFISKGREILSFMTQQSMPVAQEGIEKMTPTMGKVAKEITKNIKEGLKDNNEK